MAYCAKCGKQVGENEKFCPGCGAPVNGGVRSGDSASSNDTLMGILSYLGILVLIPFLIKDQTPFVRAHAVRGMNLMLLEIIA